MNILNCRSCDLYSDIGRRSQNSYTAPCNGRHQPWSSNWGYLGFCRPHVEKTQTKCIYDLYTRCGVSRMFIFKLRPQYICTWWITVILITVKTQIPPIGATCQDKDGVVLGSLVYICGFIPCLLWQEVVISFIKVLIKFTLFLKDWHKLNIILAVNT